VPSSANRSAHVRGVEIGSAESADGQSGVTVVLFPKPAATVVDVRGGASATYDVASLSLESTFGIRWALFLTGGSLFGLDAAAGIRQYVLDRGGGVPFFTNPHRVAPVSGAALFDLPSEPGPLPDYRALGLDAARRARPGPVATGRVGAGAGASVGKYLGRPSAMPGGLGWAVRRVGDRGHLGALVAVNAVGAVRDPSSGAWVAGARGPGGRVVPPSGESPTTSRGVGTTLVIVVTDLLVPRPALQRVAAMTHAGLGGAIVPFASASDGDVTFVASTGEAGAPPKELRPGATADLLGAAGAACAVEATISAVRAATQRR
jgi:L-aminopeptidase/D-esterase-like protein